MEKMIWLETLTTIGNIVLLVENELRFNFGIFFLFLKQIQNKFTL